ncbi:hypothetical protein WAI453_005111 [Rhynchosporium graminicola]
MGAKDKKEVKASMFRALAFRDPFSLSIFTDQNSASADQCDRNSKPVSPKSTPSSSVASTATSNATTAATSPGSPYRHTTKHNFALGTYTPEEIEATRHSSTSSDDTNSIGSTLFSPIRTELSSLKNSYFGVFKGTGTAVDGGNDSLQSPMSASQGARLSPIRLSGSTRSLSRPTSLAGSFNSDQSLKTLQSYGSSIGDGGDWDSDALLELTDEIRAMLRAKKDLSKSQIDELNLLFDAFLREEISSRPSTEIDLVIHTRFDLLLKELLNSKDTISTYKSHEVMFAKSETLRRNWERRFKGLYLNIQKPRTEKMKATGALRGLTLNSSNAHHGQTWLVNYALPADLEGDLNFIPGEWWLNMHCAFRDGAVGSVDKILTMGKSGVVALALFDGEEVNGPTNNLFEYTKITQNWDELMKLVGCNRGCPIRLLRGSNLKSKFAPKAGIRYEGLHVIKQFGHKLLDEAKNIYRCTIALERVPGQRPLHEVLKLPAPSQLDDWDLYKKMMNEDYRRCEGDAALSRRTEHEEEQRTDKEQFIKSKALQEALHRYTETRRKPSYLHD